MGMKLVLGVLAVVLLVVLLQGYIFGGDEAPASISRPGSIPTATPPANLPDPVLLGQTQGATSGGTPTAGGGGTYVVKSGDTLDAIASQFGVSADQKAAWIADVVRLNGIEDVRLLRAGQELTLPRSTAGAARTTTPAATAGAGTPTPTRPAGTATPRPGGGGTYTVVEGDTPLVIAEKLGVPESQRQDWVAQLLSLNNVTATTLQVGQVLQLPAGTPSGGGGANATATRTPTPTATRVP